MVVKTFQRKVMDKSSLNAPAMWELVRNMPDFNERLFYHLEKGSKRKYRKPKRM